MRDITKEARARETQVRKALDVLQPTTRKRTAAKKEIEDGLNLIDGTIVYERDFFYTQESRKLMKKLIAKLKDCENLSRTLARKHSYWTVKPQSFSAQIKRCERELTINKATPSHIERREGWAVDLAAILIHRYRRDDEKAAACTRGGTWHRLSGILSGRLGKKGKPIDTYKHMQRVRTRGWFVLDEDETGSNFLPSNYYE